MKCLQGFYFNFVLQSWKSMQPASHIAVSGVIDPKTAFHRQESFGPFFTFNFFYLLQPHNPAPSRDLTAGCCSSAAAALPAFAREHKGKCLEPEQPSILKN